MRSSLLCLSVSGALAFHHSAPSSLRSSLHASFQDKASESSLAENSLPKTPAIVKSQAIPFVDCPPTLAKSDLAGNVGFDPLQLANSEEQLMEYREAEVKHARLAMLAAVGYPLSELYDQQIADYYHLESVLGEGKLAPSLLNGGLDKVSPVWWGFCLGLTASIDLYGVARSRSGDDSYFPGNLGFDPLQLYPSDAKGRQRMQVAEIKHGRIAMVAITGFSVEEYVTQVGVVDETPWFFLPFVPFSETLEEMGMLSAWQ